MNLYYATVGSRIVHKVDFEQSTVTPYDMTDNWPGLSCNPYVFVQDNRRPYGAMPDLVAYGAHTASLIHPADALRHNSYSELKSTYSSLRAAVNTGTDTIGVRWNGHGAQFIRVGDKYGQFMLVDHEIYAALDMREGMITSDLYTGEIVYSDNNTVYRYSQPDNPINLNPYGATNIAAVGNIIYVIKSGTTYMKDDRVDGIVRLWDRKDPNHLRKLGRIRMFTDTIMVEAEIGIDDVATMEMFDMRWSCNPVAELPPIQLHFDDWDRNFMSATL